MLKTFELALSKLEYKQAGNLESWLKVSHSVAKGDFLFTKEEEADFLGHSKYARRDQRGKTGLQSHTRGVDETSVVEGWRKAVIAATPRGYHIP